MLPRLLLLGVYGCKEGQKDLNTLGLLNHPSGVGVSCVIGCLPVAGPGGGGSGLGGGGGQFWAGPDWASQISLLENGHIWVEGWTIAPPSTKPTPPKWRESLWKGDHLPHPHPGSESDHRASILTLILRQPKLFSRKGSKLDRIHQRPPPTF